MKKDVLIKIKGTQTINGEKDCIEIFTVGNFYKKNGTYYISYKESEDSGYNGIITTLKVEDSVKVTMLRSGASKSQLIIENGIRHQCHYDTGYGSMMIGISGNNILSRLNDQGGDVIFKYTMDINTSLASENEVYVNVEECKN